MMIRGMVYYCYSHFTLLSHRFPRSLKLRSFTSRGAHEEPGQALELSAAVRRSTGLVVEQQTQVGAHGGNASA